MDVILLSVVARELASGFENRGHIVSLKSDDAASPAADYISCLGRK